MDQNLAQRRRGLEEKIPDIKKTLSMIEFLHERRVSVTDQPRDVDTCTNAIHQEGKQPETGDDDDDLDDEDELEDEERVKKPIKTTFELNDTLYAEAELEDTDTVYLWLGVRFL